MKTQEYHNHEEQIIDMLTPKVAREDKVGDLVVEDYNIRKYLKNKLYSAGVAKIGSTVVVDETVSKCH